MDDDRVNRDPGHRDSGDLPGLPHAHDEGRQVQLANKAELSNIQLQA